MPALDPIEAQIRAKIEGVARDANQARGWKDKEWTCETKSRLTSLGSTRGYRVTCNNPYQWNNYLAWMKSSTDGLDDTLIFKIQWKQRETPDDFGRLLMLPARLRVMVFTAYLTKKNGPKHCINDLIKQIQASGRSQPGERYFFAAWDQSCRAFDFSLYVS